MNKLFKTTLVTLCVSAAVSASALAESALLPVRSTLENAGYTVTWEQSSQSVTITKDDFSLTEKIGDTLILYKNAAYAPEEFFDDIYLANKAPESEEYTAATIVEVADDYILANSDDLGLVKFMVDENTNIHHERNKMLYRLDALEPDMTIKVNHSDAMTLSLPPQTYAYEVVITN